MFPREVNVPAETAAILDLMESDPARWSRDWETAHEPFAEAVSMTRCACEPLASDSSATYTTDHGSGSKSDSDKKQLIGRSSSDDLEDWFIYDPFDQIYSKQ